MRSWYVLGLLFIIFFGVPGLIASLDKGNSGHLTVSTSNSGADRVDELIAGLKDPDFLVSNHAAVALSKIGTTALDPLIAAMRDPNSKVRSLSAQTLGEIKDSRAVVPLITALKTTLSDPDRGVEESAKSALAKIGPPSVEPLIAALEDPQSQIQGAAAQILGKIKDRRAVEPLIAALRDCHIRSSVVTALGEIQDSRAVRPLSAALEDPTCDVRWDAIRALIILGSPGSEGVLIATLDRDWPISGGIAQLFLNTGNPLLEKVGREWAFKRGVRIEEIRDPHRNMIRWGVRP